MLDFDLASEFWFKQRNEFFATGFVVVALGSWMETNKQWWFLAPSSRSYDKKSADLFQQSAFISST